MDVDNGVELSLITGFDKNPEYIKNTQKIVSLQVEIEKLESKSKADNAKNADLTQQLQTAKVLFELGEINEAEIAKMKIELTGSKNNIREFNEVISAKQKAIEILTARNGEIIEAERLKLEETYGPELKKTVKDMRKQAEALTKTLVQITKLQNIIYYSRYKKDNSKHLFPIPAVNKYCDDVLAQLARIFEET